jgi:ATP-binding cassette, subfamily B, bacterial MsbA
MIISAQYYQRLLEYVTPYRKMLALALLGMTLMALILSALPALILHLIDNTIVNKNQELMQQILLAIIVLFVIRGAMQFISNYAINTVSSELATDLRLAMFKKLLALPNHRYTTLTDSEVTVKFITDLNQLIYVFTRVITILVKDSVTIIGLLAWMFYLNRELTLFALLITALLIIITQLINGLLTHTNSQLAQETKKVVNSLVKTKNNYRTITLHGSQSHESDRFTNNIDQMQCAHMKQVVIRSLRIILTQIFVIIVCSAIGYLAIQQVYYQEITPGRASSIILAALMLTIPIKQILSVNKFMLQGQQSLDQIFSFLDQKTNTETRTVNIKRALGELVFDGVSYYHDSQTQPILKNITLTIKPGEIVAIINDSENSNAALIDLILRFCQPSNGKIFLDGHDLANLESTSLYANIALLPRNVPLIDDTVAANIAYGETRCANEAKITAAAQASHAMAFIREMPQGLQTLLGEHEAKLTEKQRLYIGIARILLKDSPILILEEIPAMSNYTSDNLQDVLQILMQGRTTMIFTQHSSIIEKANRIITIKNGEMTEAENYT